jgi:hypothetical protein
MEKRLFEVVQAHLQGKEVASVPSAGRGYGMPKRRERKDGDSRGERGEGRGERSGGRGGRRGGGRSRTAAASH